GDVVPGAYGDAATWAGRAREEDRLLARDAVDHHREEGAEDQPGQRKEDHAEQGHAGELTRSLSGGPRRSLTVLHLSQVGRLRVVAEQVEPRDDDWDVVHRALVRDVDRAADEL